MSKRLKTIPEFQSEDDERDFWAIHDTTEYFDNSKMIRGHFPDLKPSRRMISIRLPEFLIERLKILANKRDIPYQSLLKIFLSEKVEEEFHHTK
ncbi:MAG: BrnA antitoxin family protein [Nitrospirota bacterium]